MKVELRLCYSYNGHKEIGEGLGTQDFCLLGW